MPEVDAVIAGFSYIDLSLSFQMYLDFENREAQLIRNNFTITLS